MTQQTIKLKFGTVQKVQFRGGMSFVTNELAALAIDAHTGAAVQRMMTVARLRDWLEGAGFVWIAGSNGLWSRAI